MKIVSLSELGRIIFEPSDTRFELDFEIKYLIMNFLCWCSESSNPFAIC